MGERKIINKYIPADFDPRLVPRSKKPKDALKSVRMMLPFSIQCQTCSSFMYAGRKFNSKKENVKGDKGTYLGIQRFRFYIKCTACSRPISFLTDPKNADYEMESGATRNFEASKETGGGGGEGDESKEKGDDPMRALEERVLASQREMADLDALEEVRALNMRHRQIISGTSGGGRGEAGGVGVSAILDARDAGLKGQEEEALTESGLTASEEALVASIEFGAGGGGQPKLAVPRDMDEQPPSSVIRRLDDADEADLEERRRREGARLERQQAEVATKAAAGLGGSSPLLVIKAKKRRRVDGKVSKADPEDNGRKEIGGSGLGGLLGGYGSDSSDSDSD